jgi:hypothetical protein
MFHVEHNVVAATAVRDRHDDKPEENNAGRVGLAGERRIESFPTKRGAV